MLSNSLYRSPFQLIDNIMQLPPFGSESVYVISDSEYKKIRQKQAEDEIAVLQKRLEAYERSAEGFKQLLPNSKRSTVCCLKLLKINHFQRPIGRFFSNDALLEMLLKSLDIFL